MVFGALSVRGVIFSDDGDKVGDECRPPNHTQTLLPHAMMVMAPKMQRGSCALCAASQPLMPHRLSL